MGLRVDTRNTNKKKATSKGLWTVWHVAVPVLFFCMSGLLGASGLVLQGVCSLDTPALRLWLEPPARELNRMAAGLGMTALEQGVRDWWRGLLDAPVLGAGATGTGPLVPAPAPASAEAAESAALALDGSSKGTSPTSTSDYGPTRPFRLVVVGDSQAMGPDFAFKRDVGADSWFSYQGEYRLSSTLVNPGVHDWTARLEALLGTQGCDALVVFLGSNDGQAMIQGQKELAFASPLWVEEFKKRARAFMTLASGASKRVYWVPSPPMRNDSLNSRVQAANRWYKEVAGEFPNILWMDFSDLLCDSRGRYVQSTFVQGQQLEIRKEDGIHLSRTGYELVCARILNNIHDSFAFNRPRPVYRIFGQNLSGL